MTYFCRSDTVFKATENRMNKLRFKRKNSRLPNPLIYNDSSNTAHCRTETFAKARPILDKPLRPDHITFVN